MIISNSCLEQVSVLSNPASLQPFLWTAAGLDKREAPHVPICR
jgi:hypothetical protein